MVLQDPPPPTNFYFNIRGAGRGGAGGGAGRGGAGGENDGRVANNSALFYELRGNNKHTHTQDSRRFQYLIVPPTPPHPPCIIL